MKLKGIAALAMVTSLMVTTPAGHAQLIDQGGTTFDPLTNLLWLDTSSTSGISAQSILTGTDPGNLMAAGWSFASISQIDTLLTNAGMIGPFNGSNSPLNFAAASSFLTLFGATGSFGTNSFIQAFSSDSPSPGLLYTPVVLADSGIGIGGADLMGAGGVPATVTNPTIGSWLVMSSTAPPPVAAVPEPEIYAMMGVGLGVLGWLKRRQKRRDTAAS